MIWLFLLIFVACGFMFLFCMFAFGLILFITKHFDKLSEKVNQKVNAKIIVDDFFRQHNIKVKK